MRLSLAFTVLLSAMAFCAHAQQKLSSYRDRYQLKTPTRDVTRHRMTVEDLVRRVHALQQQAEAAQTAGKTSGTGLRVIAESEYEYAFSSTSDSFKYAWSGSRGSAFNFDGLYFEKEYTNPAYGFPQVMFDTVWGFDMLPPVYKYVRHVKHYNAAGRLTVYDDRDMNDDINRHVVQYNSQGMPSMLTLANYDPLVPGWDSISRSFYVYDAAGRLVRDSNEFWNGTGWIPEMVNAYVYNAAGFPIKGSLYFCTPQLVLSGETTITYNSANNPVSTRTKGILLPNPGLQDVARDTSVYVSGKRTMLDAYVKNGNSWVIDYQERRRLNTAALPDSVWKRQVAPGGDIITISKLAYNASGLPVTQTHYLPGNSSPETQKRYFYETYTTTGIADHAAAQSLSFYPNPADHSITIRKFDGAAGVVRYSILNSAGQTLQSATATARAVALTVSSLPAGNYFIVAQDEQGGRATAQFVKL